MTDQNALFKLTKARIALITEYPFYGALALRLRLVEEPSFPTLAVDGERMFYNPQFVNEVLTPNTTKAAIAHEVGHCIFEHIARRGDRNHMKWNMAGDFVINDHLLDSGFELGDGWLHNPAWKNMTADHIYTLLPDPPKGGKGPGVGDPGGALCDIMDADVRQNPMAADEWKIAAVQAAMAAKQAGKLPANLERFIHDLTHPKADWRQILRRFIVELRKDDFSWMRPKKMMIPHGFYLPTLHSEGMGELKVVIDTSGSIDEKTLNAFGSEIQAIRDNVRPRITRIIYCDARVNHVDEFAAEDYLELKPYGGGGTDFRPPFELALEQGWRPAVGIYLTDGYGPFPDMPPDYPFLWCMTTDVEPPWGERVQIEVD
jgi:predicted metal-dependent peptidase